MATALRWMGSSYVLQFFGCSLIFCAFAHADSSCEPYLTATSLIEAASRQELTLATFPEAHRNVPNLTYVQTSLVTFGSAPPPRAASNVGQSDVLVCAANQGYSLAGLQSQLVQTINGLLYGNPTGSGLGVVSDESTCLERINGQQAFAAESEENSDAMATEQLPPPVYLYAHTYNTRNRSLTVRVSRPSGETGAGDLVLQTVLRGEPDTNVYEFGEDGTLLGPGDLAPGWISHAAASPPCVVTATVDVSDLVNRRAASLSTDDASGDAASGDAASGIGAPIARRDSFYTIVTMATGGADALPPYCYGTQCIYTFRRQIAGGYIVYVDLAQSKQVLDDEGRDLLGIKFRLNFPTQSEFELLNNSFNPNADLLSSSMRVGLVDAQWRDFTLRQLNLAAGRTASFTVPLTVEESRSCPRCPNGVRYEFDNQTVLSECGMCPTYAYVIVWRRNDPSASSNSPCLGEDESSGPPSCVQQLPVLLLTIEPDTHSRIELLFISIMIALTVLAGCCCLVCTFDALFIPLKPQTCTRPWPALKALCALLGRACCCCCPRIACGALCASIWSRTRWFVNMLWWSSGSAPPGPFPLQLVVAFVLWWPFMLTFPANIEELVEAFVVFFRFFIGSDPLFLSTKEAVRIFVICIIVNGILVMAAAWHISWFARQIALGQPPPASLFQWARLPTNKAPKLCCNRIYMRAKSRLAGVSRQERRISTILLSKSCYILGEIAQGVLDLVVYLPQMLLLFLTTTLLGVCLALFVASFPVEALADAISGIVNATNAQIIWSEIKGAIPSSDDNVTAALESLYVRFPQPQPCLPFDVSNSVDRWSFAQRVFIPLGSSLIAYGFERRVSTETEARTLRDVVDDAADALSDSISAPPEYTQRCAENLFYYLVQLDVVRLFLYEATNAGIDAVSEVATDATEAVEEFAFGLFSSSKAFSDSLYDLADSTKGLILPAVLAVIAIGLTVNVWTRSYGFLKGLHHLPEHCTEAVFLNVEWLYADSPDSSTSQDVPTAEGKSELSQKL